MTRPLEGKLGIVTGASRGIGAAIAENLASKGCDLVLNFVSDSVAEQAKEYFALLATKYSVRTHGVQADVSTREGAAKLVSEAQALFGPSSSSSGETQTQRQFQIDILVNNAGIARNALLPDVTDKDFHDVYRVNVLGPLLVTQAVAPFLPSDRSGRVVSVSSISSSTGFVTQTVYGGSKAAVEAMTRTWARELAERATVNAVNPGPVEGPMYKTNTPEFMAGIKGWIMHAPLMAARPGVDPEDVVADAAEYGGRLARTSEVASIVGMLCGEDSGWCTGQVICANGGLLMSH